MTPRGEERLKGGFEGCSGERAQQVAQLALTVSEGSGGGAVDPTGAAFTLGTDTNTTTTSGNARVIRWAAGV